MFRMDIRKLGCLAFLFFDTRMKQMKQMHAQCHMLALLRTTKKESIWRISSLLCTFYLYFRMKSNYTTLCYTTCYNLISREEHILWCVSSNYSIYLLIQATYDCQQELLQGVTQMLGHLCTLWTIVLLDFIKKILICFCNHPLFKGQVRYFGRALEPGFHKSIRIAWYLCNNSGVFGANLTLRYFRLSCKIRESFLSHINKRYW